MAAVAKLRLQDNIILPKAVMIQIPNITLTNSLHTHLVHRHPVHL